MSFVFTDRESTYPNRYMVTKENGTSEFVILERADEPVVVGTPLNAETFNTLTEALEQAAAAGVAVVGGNLAVEAQKYTITLSLEGGGSDVIVLETDENDYPSKVTVNGREILWSVTGV